MDLKLKDKVALITGSSRGIGLATATAFAAEGCRLVLSARSAEPLAAAEAALRADGGAVVSCLADVGQPGYDAVDGFIGEIFSVVEAPGNKDPEEPGPDRFIFRGAEFSVASAQPGQ